MKIGDTVYLKLRRRLVSGYYDPGTQLKEELLAEEFSVSRTPIRSALARLMAEGLMTPAEKRGAIVTPWRVENTEDVFALRSLLEGHGAFLCAKNASDEDIAAVERTCDEMEHAYSHKIPEWKARLTDGNLFIRSMLFDASGSPHLRLSGRHLLEIPQVIGGYYIYENEDVEESLRQHREIVRGIKMRNGEWARSAVVCHLSAAFERFRGRASDL